MRVRSFRVQFSRVVPDDATEVEYGPDDHMVVRPLFGLPSGVAQQWARRLSEVRVAAVEAEASSDQATVDAAGETVDSLILDLLSSLVDGWRLDGPDGPIPKPATVADLDALPLALRNALFGFFVGYRGDAPDPTPSG